MLEVISGFIILYVISQIPLFIGGFMIDFFFKERHKQLIEKTYKSDGGLYSSWSKYISPIFHHPQWPILVHGLILAIYVIFIFLFNMHWIILLSWILTYYNEDWWYYIGKKTFYFEYLPAKLPWLDTFMPIKSIKDKDIPKSSFMIYLKIINVVNIIIMLLVYSIFII